MSLKNTQVILANRPRGRIQECDFRIVQTDLPALQDREVLVKNIFLSLDHYMFFAVHGVKNDVKVQNIFLSLGHSIDSQTGQERSYATPMKLGYVMVGSTLGEAVASKNRHFREHDIVLGYFGWQQYGISRGEGLRKITNQQVPSSAYLGVLGIPGLTAWVGLIDIGRPKSGETVVVSAAAGAVGSVVGQLAKMRGCRTVGIAGGRTKCDHVVNELGFDACVDYKAGHLIEDLASAAPAGIDVYFENVGGEILEAVLERLNIFARIPLCGFISQYTTGPYESRNLGTLIVNRVKLQGFVVTDCIELWPQAQNELEELVTKGLLKYRESIVEGLENAPQALIAMLKGEHIGKQLIKLV